MAANVNNYVRAGNAAVRKNIKIRQALAENKPRYDKIAQASVQADAKNKVNAATNNASTAKAKIESEAAMRKTKIGIDRDNKIRGYKNQARMTGMLAGGAALIGYGAMNMNKKDEPDEMLSIYQGFIDKTNSSLTDANAEITRLQGELDNFKIPDLPSKSGGTKKNGTTSTTETMDVPTGSQSNTGTEQSSALTSLTDKDFDDLAFAVSSEAALGTDDEYGVAANIITRLRSGKYGSSISEIINAPGQYEGVYTGRSKPSPEIAARFKTPEGRQKIEKFIKVLDGRTEFKGQTMINNRVKAEDPMFDTKGNFYHYAWQ